MPASKRIRGFGNPIQRYQFEYPGRLERYLERQFCRPRKATQKEVATAAFSILLAAAFGQVMFAQQAQSAADHPSVTKAQADEWIAGAASNWGKWGKDDQMGSLNYVTPAKRLQAAALVKTGIVVSLERPIVLKQRDAEIARDGKPSGIASFYEMTFRTFPEGDPHGNEFFTSDMQTFAPHGAGTHLDALCHDSDGKGHLYNGFPLKETVNEKTGCTKLGLDTLKEGIVTRGILVDMTRLKAPHKPGVHVYKEDIEAWEKQVGLKVAPGDALFVYNPPPAGTRGNTGFDLSVVPWMKERGVALTSGVAAIPDEPHADHRMTLVSAGIFLLDSPNLAALADTAARLNRWEFMLMIAAPLAPGASGYPVNPLALF